MRVDQFLWCIRKFKSRNLASISCKKNDVKVNDKIIKPSKEIVINDKIKIRKNQVWREYQIIAFPKNRVGPKLVNLYFKEITDKSIIEKENIKKFSFGVKRDSGKGRPTKKERREIDGLDLKNL